MLAALAGTLTVAAEGRATDWHLLHLDAGLAVGDGGRHDAVLGYAFSSIPAVEAWGFGGLRVGGGVYLAGPGAAPWERWTQVGLEAQVAEYLNGGDASRLRFGPALHGFVGYDWSAAGATGGFRVGLEGEARVSDTPLRFRLGAYYAFDSDMGSGFAVRLTVEYSVWPPIVRVTATGTNPRI